MQFLNKELSNGGHTNVSLKEATSFVFNIQRRKNLLERESSIVDRKILAFFASVPEELSFLLKNQEKFREYFSELKKQMESLKEPIPTSLVEEKDENGNLVFVLESGLYGRKTQMLFDWKKAESLEWKQLRELSQNLKNFSPLPLHVKWNKVKFENSQKENKPLGNQELFYSYESFYDKLILEARKGVVIQRYKGLGEMNPDQLWETTLNSENRRLLRVTLEDSMQADETFSVLMGEMVEPRRQFIYDNALSVNDLDV